MFVEFQSFTLEDDIVNKVDYKNCWDMYAQTKTSVEQNEYTDYGAYWLLDHTDYFPPILTVFAI